MPKNYLPDLRFLPENYKTVTAATLLNDGISLGSFLNGITLDHIPSLSERQQLIRNLLPHAQILKVINNNNKKFAEHKLVVVEGVYNPDNEEQITESDDNQNFLAKTGRGVVYELRRNKKTDNDKTFELAKYLQVYHPTFDKLILDYDTYNEGELNAQLIIQTPEIPINYDIRFKRVSQTNFNNTVQAIGQLVEITETPDTTVEFPADTPDQVTGYFTVGDLHARLLRTYGGDPWQSYAVDSRTSRDVAILQNISKIKSGSIVVISFGYNDTINTNDPPEVIARRVYKAVAISLDRGHIVSFMLLPITNKAPVSRSNAVRNAIINELSRENNVRIIDLNNPQYTLGNDGQAMTPESYVSISNVLI
jgi:hypothetical protein